MRSSIFQKRRQTVQDRLSAYDKDGSGDIDIHELMDFVEDEVQLKKDFKRIRMVCVALFVTVIAMLASIFGLTIFAIETTKEFHQSSTGTMMDAGGVMVSTVQATYNTSIARLETGDTFYFTTPEGKDLSMKILGIEADGANKIIYTIKGVFVIVDGRVVDAEKYKMMQSLEVEEGGESGRHLMGGTPSWMCLIFPNSCSGGNAFGSGRHLSEYAMRSLEAGRSRPPESSYGMSTGVDGKCEEFFGDTYYGKRGYGRNQMSMSLAPQMCRKGSRFLRGKQAQSTEVMAGFFQLLACDNNLRKDYSFDKINRGFNGGNFQLSRMWRHLETWEGDGVVPVPAERSLLAGSSQPWWYCQIFAASCGGTAFGSGRHLQETEESREILGAGGMSGGLTCMVFPYLCGDSGAAFGSGKKLQEGKKLQGGRGGMGIALEHDWCCQFCGQTDVGSTNFACPTLLTSEFSLDRLFQGSFRDAVYRGKISVNTVYHYNYWGWDWCTSDQRITPENLDSIWFLMDLKVEFLITSGYYDIDDAMNFCPRVCANPWNWSGYGADLCPQTQSGGFSGSGPSNGLPALPEPSFDADFGKFGGGGFDPRG